MILTFLARKKLSNDVSKDKELFITKFQGQASASTTYIELWNCFDDDSFSESTTLAECANELPDREKCQLVYAWTTADNNALTLPSDVSFHAGNDKFFDKLFFVAKVDTSATSFTLGVSFNSTSRNPGKEAGVMTAGVKPSSISLKHGIATAHSANTCQNECALVGNWYIFSSTSLVQKYGQSVRASFYHDGIFRRYLSETSFTTRPSTSVFTNSSTNQYLNTELAKISKDDFFSISCNYDTSTATETVMGGNKFDTTESCLTYFNFYPRVSGIKSCLNKECKNHSGDADFFTNVIVNYIALSLASMLVGVIFGIIFYILFGFAAAWFSANSARFTKDNFMSFEWISPMWWITPYAEEEEEGEEKEKLVESDDEAKINIPSDNV